MRKVNNLHIVLYYCMTLFNYVEDVMKKIINFTKNNRQYLLLTIIGIVVSILTFKVEIDIRKLHAVFGFYKYLIFFIIFILGLLFSGVVYFLFYKKVNPEKIFLYLIIPIGLLYVFIIPLGRAPDENTHFYRSYEISIGNVIAKKNEMKQGGDYLPDNINEVFSASTKYKDEKKNINIKFSNEKKFVSFPNTSMYSFITYFPQVLGVTIGRLLNLPILWVAFLGRLSNYLVWLLFMYFSIKIIPFKKLSLLIIMFLPMMLQESISLSADALTNGTTFLFISYILYFKYEENAIVKKKHMIIISLVAVLMSICKIVYLPICLLIFLIPKRKFKNKKIKFVWIGLLALLVCIVSFFFFSLTIGYVLRTELNINTVSQLHYIFSNPFRYLLVIFRTIYKDFHLFVVSFVGEALCWYDVTISPVFTKLMWLIIIIVIILDNIHLKVNCFFLYVFVTLSVIVLIFTSEYLSWTPVGSLFIEGVQGRYFIPLFIPCLMMFNLGDLKYDLTKIYKYLFMIMIFINISVLATLFVAHVG